MSGIAGIIKTAGEQVSPDELTRSGDAIAHRGPDGQGRYLGENAGLVHRLLSIPSSASVPQPLTNEDDSLVLVCDGRIYNHQELRRLLEAKGHVFSGDGDIEVLLHLYEEYGDTFLAGVNGMFALALWDKRNRRLTLGRDRIGIKPLRSEEHTSELQSHSFISYAVFCLKKKKITKKQTRTKDSR